MLEFFMKLSKIYTAVLLTASLPLAAQADVSITPLVGYSYTDDSEQKQRTLYTESTVSQGVALQNDVYLGGALGIDITPKAQLQVEYGTIDTTAENEVLNTKYDAKQDHITGNVLLSKGSFGKNHPYLLLGAGEMTTEIKDNDGNEFAKHKDTIGNIGLGTRYEINDNVALRGEVRGVYNFENKWWDGLALAGAELSFGRTMRVKETPKEVQLVEPEMLTINDEVEFVPILPVQTATSDGDDDNDGVPNSRDACPNTPQHLLVDERGCPLQARVAEHLQLELRVFFDKDKSEIKPQFRQEVAKVASAMQEFPNASAVIEGHASKDSARSNSRYNQRLSEARAAAVRSMLVNEFGVAPNRLSAVGYGFDKPITTNDTEEGRSMNRRVIAVIQGDRIQTVDREK